MYNLFFSKQQFSGVAKHSPEEALAFLLTYHLSKEQYNAMKSACASKNADCWPNYNLVCKQKKQCRPKDICYSEMAVTVGMQDLLDHTAQQIFDQVKLNTSCLLKIRAL